MYLRRFQHRRRRIQISLLLFLKKIKIQYWTKQLGEKTKFCTYK